MKAQLNNYAGPSDAMRMESPIRPDDDQELFFRHQIQQAEASQQKADRKKGKPLIPFCRIPSSVLTCSSSSCCCSKEETAAEKKARKRWQLEKRIEWLRASPTIRGAVDARSPARNHISQSPRVCSNYGLALDGYVSHEHLCPSTISQPILPHHWSITFSTMDNILQWKEDDDDLWF
jgi:hypothetical protein